MNSKIYTLGYTSTTPEELKEIAEKLGAIICDIRINPRSRAPRWNLVQFREAVGWDNYQYLGFCLGNKNYKGGPIELADPQQGVKLVRELLGKKPVILVCACYYHASCHRLEAANLITVASGSEIEHLYGSRKAS